MDKKDITVGTGLVGAPACGDVMKLQIKVSFGKTMKFLAIAKWGVIFY
jgi:NifU-like protein involved in Fe-S cluster formation